MTHKKRRVKGRRAACLPLVLAGYLLVPQRRILDEAQVRPAKDPADRLPPLLLVLPCPAELLLTRENPLQQRGVQLSRLTHREQLAMQRGPSAALSPLGTWRHRREADDSAI